MINLLLAIIFIRPFISSLAFPYLDFACNAFLLVFWIAWAFSYGLPLKNARPFRYPLAILIIAVAVSIAFSPNKAASLKDLDKYVNGLMLFIIASSFSAENTKKVIRTLVFCASVIAVLGIYQYFFGFRQLFTYMDKEYISYPFACEYAGRRRIFFPFATPNILAGYLAMIAPLAFTQHKKSSLLILSVMLFALFFTASIGAFLSLCFALFVYVYFRRGFTRKNIAVFLLVSIFFITVFALRQMAIGSHLTPTASYVNRIDYWIEAARLIIKHPLHGVGLGNFFTPSCKYAHNSYLQFWAEAGTPGIVSLAWFLILAVRSSVRICRRNTANSCLNLSLLCANAAFLAHNFIDFTFFLPEISILWWVILGLSVAQEEKSQ